LQKGAQSTYGKHPRKTHTAGSRRSARRKRIMANDTRKVLVAAGSFPLPALPLFLIILLVSLLPPACGAKKSENVLTGYDLDADRNVPRRLSSQFRAGEPFSLVLKPVQFRDSFVELIIYSIGPDGKMHRSRDISLSGIDTNENFLQIGDAFQIPFPGRYRISFEQLGTVLGWTEVEIIP
jgi:hypothetical protein